MKNALIILFLLIGFTQSIDCKAYDEAQNNAANSNPELLNYLLGLSSDFSDNKISKDSDLGLRGKQLQNKGLTFGIQGGKYWASKQIKNYLDRKSAILDKNFDFRLLVVKYKGFIIIPAVIDQLDGKTVYSSTGRQIRTAESVYDIRSMPRFTTFIPTWKDYIKFEEVPPVIKFVSTLPNSQKPEEIELWKKSVAEGWLQGIEQAVRNANTQIAVLVSDYRGMIRFHILRDLNMIEDFEISEQFNEVVGGGSSMSINDVIINITVNPALQSNRHEWLPVPQLPPLTDVFPQGVYFTQDMIRRGMGADNEK
ncbi:type IV secretion system DotC family protein (plasmid) [Shewanella xiamenensis]|uniref:Type IV secretion system DotC family protein n=1 Tax=Shewanella xiamenensis TaxID=332186 RepID=A0ABT6UJ30_9GAMM|nr:type IV secretory system conjugative DNA transfer family protein [Shewanella xiamenensis]MDI5833294.1 type IV secretion system DotC family protein [Shewanella xiamenensis]WHF57956.1 type IV secretion system DotC family protein [Shewanella xiamenensis]